jgi:CubicO group peptidase (beta-lactamase class C family)
VLGLGRPGEAGEQAGARPPGPGPCVVAGSGRAGVGTITFGELLTHRAGFRLDSGLVFKTGNAAREQIRQGIQQIDKQGADYNNINFTIFRDMLPFMEGAPQPGPAARAAAADRFFLSYMQRQVFDPVGVTDATCAPVRDAALIYPPPGARTARGRQAPVPPSACAGGGWFMTPASMLRVLEGLISDGLLSRSQRQQMDRNCLGWDCSITSQLGYRGKGGGPFCDGSWPISGSPPPPKPRSATFRPPRPARRTW